MKKAAKVILISIFIIALLAVVCIMATIKAKVPESFAETAETKETEETEVDIKSLYPDKVVKRSVKAGDTITFGNYPQDKDGTARPVEWLVLDAQDGHAFMVSKKALDYRPYHNKNARITWKNCSLRSWLNKEFYNTAFTKKEQERIIETTHLTPANNYEKSIYKNEETTDKVFLLSSREVSEYFNEDRYFRKCLASDYIFNQVNESTIERNKKYGESLELMEECTWWIRNPGKKEYSLFSAGVVSFAGVLFQDEGQYIADKCAVRPAVVVDVSSVTVEETVSTIPRNLGNFIEINEKAFPDEKVRSVLSLRYDLDNDGYYSEDEISLVKKMDLKELGLTSLQGLEYFTSLEELDVSKNSFNGTLDLSLLSGLKSFTMNSNKGRDGVNLVFGLMFELSSINCCFSKISSIDVSACTNLETLQIEYNDLSEINLSNNYKLKELYCGHNQLDGIDVKNNTELETLVIGPNQYDYYSPVDKKNSIGNLDLRNNPNLKVLIIDWCGIGILDISNCTKLEKLNITGNTNVFYRMKWTSLDKLKYLSCVQQSITSLDMSKFPSLETLVCAHNKLTELDISSSKIQSLDCKYNQLTKLILNQDVEYFDCSSNKLTNLDITKSTRLSGLNCSKNMIKKICLKAHKFMWSEAKRANKNHKYANAKKTLTLECVTDNDRISFVFDQTVLFTFK